MPTPAKLGAVTAHGAPRKPLPSWEFGFAHGANLGCESLGMNAVGPIPLHQTVVLADNHGCDSFGFGMAGSKPIGPESLHRGATQECAEEQLAMI